MDRNPLVNLSIMSGSILSALLDSQWKTGSSRRRQRGTIGSSETRNLDNDLFCPRETPSQSKRFSIEAARWKVCTYMGEDSLQRCQATQKFKNQLHDNVMNGELTANRVGTPFHDLKR